MNYRNLNDVEIAALERQSCSSTDWGRVLVSHKFKPDRVRDTVFSGDIKMGVFEAEFALPGGVSMQSGLSNVRLHNCVLADNVFVADIKNYIANYSIGQNTFIQNVHAIYVEGESSFGNGVAVSVLNETGGREVLIYDKLSAHFAYIMSFYRHRPLLIERMQDMVCCYSQLQTSGMGTIGQNVRIVNAGTIKNVRLGDHCLVDGATHLENGSVNSNAHDPVHVGNSVIAHHFIISSGSKVLDGTMLTRCFVGQACQLGHTYSASDTLFFSNCQGENGEACAVFAGPFTVTHHKSTLLIAGMFSFMNAGSGSNQSNHMYKLGPIHQGVVERGGKTTSDSYILWPARIGAYSLIMGRHQHNSDTSALPFSYLIEQKGMSVLVPGVNLRSVGTIRDAQKFPKRDNRKDPEQLDQINYNLLSPYTVQKMLKGIEVLTQLQVDCGETSDHYTYQSCTIKNTSLRKGLLLYKMAVHKFLGNSIISRLEHCPCVSDEQVRAQLMPTTELGLNQWHDLSGLLAPQSTIDNLIEAIESGSLSSTPQVNEVFEQLHLNYYLLEWTWAWDKIKSFYKVTEEITRAEVIKIVEQWKVSVVELDHMVYDDARKEFSLSSRTGFGLDGGKHEKDIDFEQVRGAFESNPFVEAVVKHIAAKTTLGNELMERLRS